MSSSAKSSSSSKDDDPYQYKVHDIISQMTLQEKIMQIGQIDKAYAHKPEDIKTYALGSLISGGSGQPFENSPIGFANMIDNFQEYALKSRLHIPLLYGGDAVHGMSLSKGTTIFPHNIGLGAANDPELVEDIATATAIETSCTGVYWAFAPCVAVVEDARWGRTYESFGQDPDLVAFLGAAHIRGLQGTTGQGRKGREKGRVAACAKHYVGDGGVAFGSGTMGEKLLDRGDCQMDEATIRATHLKPYVEAVKAGVLSVMVSFSALNGVQMHANTAWLRDVLRDELSFKGLVVSDWGAHNQLREGKNQKEKLALTINAGVDLIMIPEHYKVYLTDMEAAMKEGLISEDRLNEAVAAVLRLKYQLGLFENPLADRELLDQVRCHRHLALARKAVAQSLVLLKNRSCVLPFDASTLNSLFVCGKGADDLGLICGGWTASWQGSKGEVTDGTTILRALVEALPGTAITYDVEGKGLDPVVHQAAVVVLAEDPPYAEWFGDRSDLNVPAEDQALLDRLTGKGVPVIVIICAGRPLLAKWQAVDALIMGWLPGSEGGNGIVDVLLGQVNFTGRMPLSLPDSLDVDPDTRELFARDSGLSYSKPGTVPEPMFLRREIT